MLLSQYTGFSGYKISIYSFYFFISVSLCHEVVKELIDFFVSLSIPFCCCYFVQIIGIKKKNNYKIRISPSASINLL